jgi:hypothetical protein
MFIASLSLNSALDIENGQRQALAALGTGKLLRTRCTRGWVDLMLVWTVAEVSTPTGIRSSGPSRP